MDYRTLHLLLRCGREFSHNSMRRQELNDTECMICSYIHSSDGCSQDDVAEALKTDKTTVAKALACLEEKNCVTRTVDEADRRVKRLSLTSSGREKTETLVKVHNDWLSRVMECLSEDEKTQFENCCGRLLSAAENLRKENGENKR